MVDETREEEEDNKIDQMRWLDELSLLLLFHLSFFKIL